MKKSLYLTAVVGNFLLLVYAAVLIVGICGGWLDRELWLHSDVAKVAQLLLMASAMGLLFANIRISRVRYGGKYLSLILCGNFFVNPFLSFYFLSGKADGKQESETFPKRKVYLFLRNVQLFWLLYTLAAVFIQRNIAIAIKQDTPGYILLNVWFCFFYAPIYSRRVLKNKWL